MTSAVVLRLTDVTKTYPGVVALDGVTLDVLAGEVQALF
jgi:ABC-type sugar transport system ATPase subunit